MHKLAKKNSRVATAIESVVVAYGEELFTCHHCNSRTDLVIQCVDGSRRERCVHCGQAYDITDEIEDIGEEDEPALRDATQVEVEHLFGIKPSPYGKVFGSY
ncbi:MAG: hypothetical protein NVS3B3_04510 [Aquirhabdus sp.]